MILAPCVPDVYPEQFPRPQDEAWDIGFNVAMICETSEPPVFFDRAEADSFRAGWLAGEQAREPWFNFDPEPDWDSMYPDHDDHHENEVVEALGVLAMRSTGGEA